VRIVRWILATWGHRIAVGALAVLAIPILALAWWLGSPLFISTTVDEEFPMTVSAEIPPGTSRIHRSRRI